MCFSDNLRIKICEKYSIDLEQYVWNDELNEYLMSIQLGTYEELIHTMNQVFEFGFNIGCCGLTSRHFSIALKTSKLAYGRLPILKGTKSSKDGNHAWIIYNGFIIDSTLKLLIPEKIASSIGYSIERILADDSARMLSEYELYSNYVTTRERDISKFNENLLLIN